MVLTGKGEGGIEIAHFSVEGKRVNKASCAQDALGREGGSYRYDDVGVVAM